MDTQRLITLTFCGQSAFFNGACIRIIIKIARFFIDNETVKSSNIPRLAS